MSYIDKLSKGEVTATHQNDLFKPTPEMINQAILAFEDVNGKTTSKQKKAIVAALAGQLAIGFLNNSTKKSQMNLDL